MTRNPRIAALMCCLAVAASTSAQRVPSYYGGALERRIHATSDLRAVPTLHRAEELRGTIPAEVLAAEEAFRTAHGSAWEVVYDVRSGRPANVVGQGIPMLPGKNGLTWAALGIDPRDDAAVRAHLALAARRLVARHAAWLRVDDGELVVAAEGIQNPAPHLWFVRLDWAPRGIPADDAHVVLRLNHGNVVQLGVEGIGDTPASALTAMDGARAWDVVKAYVSWDTARDTLLGDPELCWVRVTPDPAAREEWRGAWGKGYAYRLTYDVVMKRGGELGTWQARVDARNGELFAFGDVNAYGRIHGKIYPAGPTTPEVDRPFPYANFGAGTFSDAGGEFAGNNGTCTLDGPYITVNDTCGNASLSTTVGNIDFGGSIGEDCTTPGFGGAGNTHAARSSYYHLTLINQKGRTYLPGNAWLNAQLTDNVNSLFYGFRLCNAFWDGSTVNFFQSGPDILNTDCANSGEVAAIYLHEWGHGLDQNDGNGASPDGGTGETYGDVTALLQTHDSCMGPGFFLGANCQGYGDTCTSCDGVRDIDWAQHASNTPHTPANFTDPRCPNASGGAAGPCGKEVHCESYPASEAVFDLSVRDLVTAGLDAATAYQLVDRLWYVTRGTSGSAFTCTLPNSSGCAASNLYQVFLMADDCDGNLANGTPHMAAIYAAFNRHAIACPTPTVQNQACCPSIAPPNVTATQGSGQVTLSWGAVANAATYNVFRNEFACDAGFTLLANTAATTYVDQTAVDGVTYYYRVQGVGSTPACTGPMSACVTPSGGGTTGNVVAGRGLGQPNPNQVRAFTSAGAQAADFLAYSAGQWGVNVAAGSITGASQEQIVTGPGPGAVFGPQVKAFLRDGTHIAKVNFYAYGTLRYGANVASGSTDGDAFAEIVSGAGPGAVFGPHVRGWNYDNSAVASIPGINYFAYATLRYGVNVAQGSVDADAFTEIVTGPGPSGAFGPLVRGWNVDGGPVTSIGGINFNAFTLTGYGVNVACGSVDADAFDEIAAAPGPGPTHPPQFKGFNVDGGAASALAGFDTTLAGGTLFGGRPGIGDVTGDTRQELLAGKGRDAAADAVVSPFSYTGSALTPLATWNAFTGSTYGVNPAGGSFGF